MSVARDFRRLRPWVTRFVIDGRAFGGDFDALGDARIAQFASAFPDARRVLELGSLEGGHSIALSRLANVEEVVAIEGRQRNIDKARLVQRLLGAEAIEFVSANLEDCDLTRFGRFDAILCVGLLYHLPDPGALLERLGAVADQIFVWTHYATAAEASHEGVGGAWYREFGPADPLSGLSELSFWPTRDGLFQLLERAGFNSLAVLHDDPAHTHGAGITLSASARPQAATR